MENNITTKELNTFVHQINNLLTVVLGHSQLLLTRELPEDVISDLKDVKKASVLMAKILSDFKKKHTTLV